MRLSLRNKFKVHRPADDMPFGTVVYLDYEMMECSEAEGFSIRRDGRGLWEDKVDERQRKRSARLLMMTEGAAAGDSQMLLCRALGSSADHTAYVYGKPDKRPSFVHFCEGQDIARLP